MTNIIACVNQKGGTAKTTTTANLGIGLAQNGKRVLLIDTDPQGSLGISLGHPQPDALPVTLSTILMKLIKERTPATRRGHIASPGGRGFTAREHRACGN